MGYVRTYRGRGMGAEGVTFDPAPVTPGVTPVETSPASAAIAPVLMTLTRIPERAAPPNPALVRAKMLDIVPASCSALNMGTLGTSEAALANQVVVMSWPFVKLSQAKVQEVLDGIYGNGAGGSAVLNAFAEGSAPRPAASDASATAAELSSSAIMIPAPPNFVACGWMPEPDAPKNRDGQAVSNGTLWIALGWPIDVTATAATNFARRVIGPLAGLPWNFQGNTALGSGGVPKLASDTSDAGLQRAAVRSASIVVAFGMALAAGLFRAGPLATVTAASSTFRSFTEAANKIDKALAALAALPSLIQQADAVAATARGATVETCPAAKAAVDAVGQALTGTKTTILAAQGAPQEILKYVRSETNPDASDFVKLIRDQIVAQVNTALPSGTALAVTKAYFTCVVWGSAKKALETQIATMASRLLDASGKAAAFSGMGDTITASLQAIDLAIASGQEAKEQSCLSVLEKDFLGAPAYVWLGGGAATLLAVIVGVKVMRSRKKKAAAAAAVAKPALTANRRRTSWSRRKRAR